MNNGCSRLDDDGDLIVVAVDEPVEGHDRLGLLKSLHLRREFKCQSSVLC
jgi:hypothetical protein